MSSAAASDADMSPTRLKRLAFNVSLDQDLLNTVTRYSAAIGFPTEKKHNRGWGGWGRSRRSRVAAVKNALTLLPLATLPHNMKPEIIEDFGSAERAVKTLLREQVVGFDTGAGFNGRANNLIFVLRHVQTTKK